MTHENPTNRGSGWTLLAMAPIVLLLAGLTGRAVNLEPVELLFIYGSEKKEWINDVTAGFHKSSPTTKDGRPIKVKAVPLGSGETVHDVLSGKTKAHLISPASGAYIKLGNAQAVEKKEKPLVKSTRNLVRSPVVIAMWKPMAEALGWPDKPIGWSDLRKLAVAADGWDSLGHKEWGAFKFGHTHPDYSNSGLIAVFAQVYAATGKEDEMTVKDIEDLRTSRFVEELQKAIVHYGSSTGFFGEQMFKNGVDYLSAAVLYENMVVESYSDKYKGKLKYPVVAVYPREGTFWSDHPVGVVERDQVGPAEREAAERYIAYLLDEPQQRKALKYGFRPGLEKLKVGSPIDKAHGVDAKQPEKILETPSVPVMRACLKSWKQNKKSARVMLVLDISGSMRKENRLENARLGALEIVTQLRDDDSLGLLTFNHEVRMLDRGSKLKGGRERLTRAIEELEASGQTALYDAISLGYRHVQSWFEPDVICAVVVLTDGEDNRSKLNLDKLLSRLKEDKRRNSVRIFTIAYGDEANASILKEIAEATQGRTWKGTPRNIKSIIREIVTFF